MDSFIAEMKSIPFWTIAFMGCLGAWSMTLQSLKIWRAKSAETLAIPFVWYAVASHCISITYGVDQSRWALVVHGILRGVALLPVIAGIIAFHNHSRTERVAIFSFSVFVAANLLLPYRSIAYVAQSLFGLGLFITQPVKIILQGQTGVLEVRVYIFLAINSMCFLYYGDTVGDNYVKYTAMLFALAQVLTVYLFWRFPEQKEQAAIP